MKLSFVILFLIIAVRAEAVLFYSTGDPSYNTNAPTGSLEGSGWQFQGRFNNYLGTPVGPHHFITAKHIGGSVGNLFHYNGQVFKTTARVDDSDSDLRLWKIDGRFSSYAPIYSNSNETGKGFVVFGTGVERGAAVTNTTIVRKGLQWITTGMTNGWVWGAPTYVQRWGTNSVNAVTTVGGFPVLKADWNENAGPDQCMLADKDSGGAVFIQEGGVWKLAGINYAVGPYTTYSFNSDGSEPFNGSILTFTGDRWLYGKSVTADGSTTNWVQVISGTKSSFYATRISSRYSWITNHVTDFDQDVDLLPDGWEYQYSGSPTGLVASADSDGDGFTNYQEYIADTNPTNAASFFEVSGILAGASQTIYFTGSTGRQYQVFFTTNDLADPGPVWLEAHSNRVWGTGPGSSITVTNTQEKAFYRLRVTLP